MSEKHDATGAWRNVQFAFKYDRAGRELNFTRIYDFLLGLLFFHRYYLRILRSNPGLLPGVWNFSRQPADPIAFWTANFARPLASVTVLI